MKWKLKNNFYLITVFLFSFFINFYTASTGVLPIDTFLHYDPASRILENIIPVRDYWIVHGLTVDYMQAIFFKLFGVNWISYLAHSSIFNAVISLITFNFFLLNNIKKLHAFFLAISFSILAYPVSGTPFIDQHAVFFCLLGFYFFFFGIKKNHNYLFFIPIFFGLAFFSKPVPSFYLIFVFIFIFIYYIIKTKQFSLIKYLIYGSIFFLSGIFIFLFSQNIEIDLFFTQIFYYTASIGGDRLASFEINYEKIFTNYKFILFPIILTFILILKFEKKKNEDINYFIFIIFVLFNFACIYHQLLTNNQNFIFFLIPINLSFLVMYLNKNFTNKRIIFLSIIALFLFSCFTTIKYHYRFNIEKKFHDLQNVNFKNSLPANKIHPSLKYLNWKTKDYVQPAEEILLLREAIKEIEKNDENIMLMTNYSFISSITKKKIFTISRTYDNISFPNKNNFYYQQYKDYFIKQINLKNISQIYLLFNEKDLLNSVNRYVYEYFDNECLKTEKINKNLMKINLKNCKYFK